jgi:hypothetical protein
VRAFRVRCGLRCLHTNNQKALILHRNAPLTGAERLVLARCVVEDGWPLRRAAEHSGSLSGGPATTANSARRQQADRSSRPHRSPRRTLTRTEHRIIKVRVLHRWGPARIAGLLRLYQDPVHRVLTRFGLAQLTYLDWATGRAIRRYERDRPGELVHADRPDRDAGWTPAQRAAGIQAHQRAAMPQEYLEACLTDPATWVTSPENLVILAALTRAAEARGLKVEEQADQAKRAPAVAPGSQRQHTTQPDQGRGAKGMPTGCVRPGRDPRCGTSGAVAGQLSGRGRRARPGIGEAVACVLSG